jgi:microsomal dipeptidase-like Zn-dependent dipeptidase
MFADLHCHCHMRSYLTLSQIQEELGEREFSPWTIIATNMTRLKYADRAAGYAQADLVALWNSGTRLVFNSMYPIEREFFMTPEKPSEGKFKRLRKIIRMATHHKAPLRTLLQHLTMRIPNATIKFITSEDYDYWNALQHEYEFICSKSGIKTLNEIYTPGKTRQIIENNKKRRIKYGEHYHAEGCYQIPRNKKEAREIADNSDNIIMMPLTIEGAHIFCATTEEEQTVLSRVDFIKYNWEYPLFFITFSHHFDNKLCGHAHSLPAVADFLLNQQPAMNTGITPLGWKVLRKLQSVDDNNNPAPDNGYRVLIDLKHMSAQARLEYYDQLIRPCMKKGDVIPLIASHCSYAARKTLKEMIELQDKEDDSFRILTENGSFYAWNINLCDEDINMIFLTGGLFGLSFDKRMLGVSAKRKEEKIENSNNINALWNNLKAVLQVIYKNDEIPVDEKIKSWDMLAIGTDFDGYIDPISDYKTALKLPDFKKDLIDIIKLDAAKSNAPECTKCFSEEFTVEMAVDNICYNNALNFTLKNYPDK